MITSAVYSFPSTTTSTTIVTPKSTMTTVSHHHETTTRAHKVMNKSMSINPYRFNYVRKIAVSRVTQPSSKQMNLVESSLSHAMTKSSITQAANNEKNWLLTKAWLIDNINRLKRELNELERDYSQHLDSIERINSQKEKQFLEDINKLRADHAVLSQQQKQIIYLIKKNQLLRLKPSENDIHYVSMNMKPTKLLDSVVEVKRQIKRDLTQSYTEAFQTETRRNTKEVFAELSALHDITLNLYDDLRNIERKIENRNKFK